MKAIRIHSSDTVAVAVEDLHPGDTVTVDTVSVTLKEEIPAGHKFSLAPVSEGAQIIKYAAPIGHAKTAIDAGCHVHTHNVRSNLGDLLTYEYAPSFTECPRRTPGTFMGYRRPDGRVGIRNEVWIVPTVGCVNTVVREMERAAASFVTPRIDGVFAYNHPYGCSQLGDDQNRTLKYLSGLIRHPNAAAVLVVGLGCENANIDELKKVLGEYDPHRVRFLVCQNEEDEVAAGVEILRELCAYADTLFRTPCPTSELVIGLKCGGSDGYSGITANPLLGTFSDRLIGEGGSAILTEVPEMFGAETLLMNRCRSEKQFRDTVSMINGFKQYFMRYGEKVDENPSPGNKAGGITTLEDKSLGCVQKGGTAPVEDVLAYGDAVRVHGLSLLYGPGNDLVAAGALAAAGAQMILFTTGRGTPFGAPVPTVKIASNSALAERKKNWIDFDAGRLLSGESAVAVSEDFYRYLLSVASGEVRAKSESWDKHELAIFKDGVTL